MTLKTGSLYYLIDGLTEPNRVEYSWKPLPSDKKPWLEFKLSAAAPLKLVKLYFAENIKSLFSKRIAVYKKQNTLESARL